MYDLIYEFQHFFAIAARPLVKEEMLLYHWLKEQMLLYHWLKERPVFQFWWFKLSSYCGVKRSMWPTRQVNGNSEWKVTICAIHPLSNGCIRCTLTNKFVRNCLIHVVKDKLACICSVMQDGQVIECSQISEIRLFSPSKVSLQLSNCFLSIQGQGEVIALVLRIMRISEVTHTYSMHGLRSCFTCVCQVACYGQWCLSYLFYDTFIHQLFWLSRNVCSVNFLGR